MNGFNICHKQFKMSLTQNLINFQLKLKDANLYNKNHLYQISQKSFAKCQPFRILDSVEHGRFFFQTSA